MATYAVLGATSWGLTLASLLARNASVVVLTRTKAEAEDVDQRRGLARLPGLVLPPQVSFTADPEELTECAGLVVVTPAQAAGRSVAPLDMLRHLPVLSASKGIEHGTNRRMSEVLEAAGWDRSLVAVLSGPNLAHEVVAGLPAAAVVAANDERVAALWQQAFSGPTFRVYRSEDVAGVELGGALKNIVAIAAGVSAGLGMGANAAAAIMTRGLAEMTRLGVALGANPLTFQGLAGVGDLSATCYSPLSRNRRLGELLAREASPAEAIKAIGEAVEGAATAPVALALAKGLDVQLPITEQVVAVLRGETDVREAMRELLGRTLTSETAGTNPV